MIALFPRVAVFDLTLGCYILPFQGMGEWNGFRVKPGMTGGSGIFVFKQQPPTVQGAKEYGIACGDVI